LVLDLSAFRLEEGNEGSAMSGLRKRGKGACAGAWLDLFWMLVVRTANRRIACWAFWVERFSFTFLSWESRWSKWFRTYGSCCPCMGSSWDAHLSKPGELRSTGSAKALKKLRSLNRLHFPSSVASLSWEEFDRDFLSKKATSICL
jgi:hypothetical protein